MTAEVMPQGPVAAPMGTPLTDEEVLGMTCPVEPYTLANGLKGWIHGLSLEEVLWVNRQASRETGSEQGLEREAQFNIRVKLWQTVRCFRSGPEEGASQVIPCDKAQALRRIPGWCPDVLRVSSICDGLTSRESEAARLRETGVRFLGSVEKCFEALQVACEAATPEELRASVETFRGTMAAGKVLLFGAEESQESQEDEESEVSDGIGD